MTDTTMRMTTTATTAPMIAQDPLPEGPPPPVLGGSWVDAPTLLLPPTAAGMLLCGVDDTTAIGCCSDEDGEWGSATVLGKTLVIVATATDDSTAEFDETTAEFDDTDREVLVTSGTAQSK